jgi:hypothetical protein
MRRELEAVVCGSVVAVAVQTLIALAETWSFGPSLRPLSLIFGHATFPVVTAITLGVPIGCLFFSAAKLLKAKTTFQLLLLIGPFALLQVIGLTGSKLNAYALFYAIVYVGMAFVGAALLRRPEVASR